jgi:RNA polymerase sigma factor (sigma-70 family)
MNESPVTRPSLLLRVRNPRDSQAWSSFVELYTPVVFNFCRSRGLQAADAADVAQEVMRSIAGAIGRFEYDPDKGSFRDWLFRVTRNKLTDFTRRRPRQAVGSGESAVRDLLEAQPAPAEEEEDWQEQWRKRVLRWAVEQVRGAFEERTWKAFWATAVENRDVKEVAAELGMSPGAVYIAKSRVVAGLRRAVEGIDEDAVESAPE